MLRASAEQAQEADTMIPWICAHNSSIALAFSRDHAIVTMNMLGPLTAEAAQSRRDAHARRRATSQMAPQKLKPRQ